MAGSAGKLGKVPVRLGEVVADKYRVDEVLGIGGMGAVLRVQHLVLRQTMAVKVPLVDSLASPEDVERFLREARAAARLSSEHVCRVLDVGVLASGSPFIVMEHLEGADLATVLRERGPVSVAEAATWTIEACHALDEAHAVGIVHRDIKPGNLFLARTRGGRRVLKVLDFGVSKVETPELVDAGGRLTSSAVMMGSPSYSAPEQLRSTMSVDARADVWALGICLYELLTGKLPFGGGTLVELAMSVVNDDPPTLRLHRADAPAELEAIVMRCLSKDPAARFATVRELAEALAPFAPDARPLDPPATERRPTAGEGTFRPSAMTKTTEKAPPPLMTDDVVAPPSYVPAGNLLAVTRRDAPMAGPMPPATEPPAPATPVAIPIAKRARIVPLIGLAIAVGLVGAAVAIAMSAKRSAEAPTTTVMTSRPSATASTTTMTSPPPTVPELPASPPAPTATADAKPSLSASASASPRPRATAKPRPTATDEIPRSR